MPTYEYRCKGCGKELEVVQSFSDDALTTCEACGGDLRKVFGSVGISFKGSGFYKNDSRGSGAKSGATAGGESSSTTSEGGSSTTADKGSGSASAPVDKPATPAKSGKGDKAAASTSTT